MKIMMIRSRANVLYHDKGKHILPQQFCPANFRHERALSFDASKTKFFHKRKPRYPIAFVSNVKQVEDSDEALSLFHEYREMGFRHDYPSYSALIYKLARARNFEAVERVLGYIRDDDVRCGEAMFIGLIQHYGKSQLVEKAVGLFHKMTSFNCTRTVQSLNTILNIFVDNDKLLDAVELLHGSTKRGFRPNSVSFNIIIKGWLKRDDWEIDGYLQVNDFEGGLKVLNVMLTSRHCPPPDTFCGLLVGLFGAGNVDSAYSVFEEMGKRKMRVNLETSLVINACGTLHIKNSTFH